MTLSIGARSWSGLVAGLVLLTMLGCRSYPITEEASMAVDEKAPPRAAVGYLGNAPASDSSAEEGLAMTPSEPSVAASANGGNSGGDATSARPDRLVIYQAQVSVQVAQFDEAADRFLSEVERMGGFLERKAGNSIVCRVPTRQFEASLAYARRLGRLVDEQVQATDVTRHHRDLRIRLENALTTRRRLLAILERASQVEDILKIETELRRLSEEIERYQAELRTLDDQIAFSTIELRFIASPVLRSPARRSSSRFGWINQVGLEQIHRGF